MKLQLLSRVKSNFRSKPEAVSNPSQSRAMSEIDDNRLAAVFSDIEKYLAANYSISAECFDYGIYPNGVSLTEKSPAFSVAVAALNESKCLYNLPDNVMLLFGISSENGNEWAAKEGCKFTKYLMALCYKYQIQHFAFPNTKPDLSNPNVVKEADVTCYRLYNVSPSNPTDKQ